MMISSALVLWDVAKVVDNYDEIRINTIIVAGDALRARLAQAEQERETYRNAQISTERGLHQAEQERDAARIVAKVDREQRDRLRTALEEIDTYLAHDPDVWRILSVAKVGEVLCEVLGAETIGRINASVGSLLCVSCRAALGSTTEPEEAEK